jgi:uncharacterized membrane protein
MVMHEWIGLIAGVAIVALVILTLIVGGRIIDRRNRPRRGEHRRR